MEEVTEFKCSKCHKEVSELISFGPVAIPEGEEGREYCEKCWLKHPINTEPESRNLNANKKE
jgi:DNA-directed RNA polymerase subunit RPC12/RpoP